MVSQVGRAVLPRDPSGRALIRGSVAAFGIMTVIFVLWVLVVSGVVAPQVLANTSGTVLAPLATELGCSAQLLAAPIALFLLGLASIRTADMLFDLVRERLVFLGIILLHGPVIWQGVVERALALAQVAVVVALTIHAVRRVDLAARGGQTVVPLTGSVCRPELTLGQDDA